MLASNSRNVTDTSQPVVAIPTTSLAKLLRASEKCDDLSLRQPRHHLTPLSIHNYIDDALLTISNFISRDLCVKAYSRGAREFSAVFFILFLIAYSFF